MIAQQSSCLAPEALRARETFDLEAAMLALPPATPHTTTSGNVGTRLRPYLVADISDDLLREYAREVLGAQRCSAQYLTTLRIVLGNQAHAERMGYPLEMNLRVSFAPERVMRTIIDQMKAAGIIEGVPVRLGQGRIQTVQRYTRKVFAVAPRNLNPEAELAQMYREEEAASDLALRHKVWPDDPWPIDPSDVPY